MLATVLCTMQAVLSIGDQVHVFKSGGEEEVVRTEVVRLPGPNSHEGAAASIGVVRAKLNPQVRVEAAHVAQASMQQFCTWTGAFAVHTHASTPTLPSSFSPQRVLDQGIKNRMRALGSEAQERQKQRAAVMLNSKEGQRALKVGGLNLCVPVPASAT